MYQRAITALRRDFSRFVFLARCDSNLEPSAVYDTFRCAAISLIDN